MWQIQVLGDGCLCHLCTRLAVAWLLQTRPASKIKETNAFLLESKRGGRYASLKPQAEPLRLAAIQALGKRIPPIHHIHIYFSVQFVHKLVARMKKRTCSSQKSLQKKERNGKQTVRARPTACIAVGTCECACPSSTFASFSQTLSQEPRLVICVCQKNFNLMEGAQREPQLLGTVGQQGARLSFRWAHKTAGDDDEMLTLFA